MCLCGGYVHGNVGPHRSEVFDFLRCLTWILNSDPLQEQYVLLNL